MVFLLTIRNRLDALALKRLILEMAQANFREVQRDLLSVRRFTHRVERRLRQVEDDTVMICPTVKAHVLQVGRSQYRRLPGQQQTAGQCQTAMENTRKVLFFPPEQNEKTSNKKPPLQSRGGQEKTPSGNTITCRMPMPAQPCWPQSSAAHRLPWRRPAPASAPTAPAACRAYPPAPCRRLRPHSA